jgi:hypothetical protein
VVVLAVVLVFAIIGLAVQNRRITSLEVRLLRLTRGNDDGNLQDVLETHLDTVARVADELDSLAARSAVLEARSLRSFQRLGFVRFNPFEDTGSNQSFALALLDGRDDGLVISSLHSRTGTRIYAKAVTGGRPDAPMSDEEAQAVEMARAGGGASGSGSAPASGVRGSGSVRSLPADAAAGAGPTGAVGPTPASGPTGASAVSVGPAPGAAPVGPGPSRLDGDPAR